MCLLHRVDWKWWRDASHHGKASVSAIAIVGRKWINDFIFVVFAVLESFLLAPVRRRRWSAGFMTDNQLSQPVKNIYWRYFWNVQNILVQPEEKCLMREKRWAGGGLKHFELHSAIGTKKQLSPVASAVKRWCESTKIIVTKWRKVHVNALTSNQAEEKMKPVDFYFIFF